MPRFLLFLFGLLVMGSAALLVAGCLDSLPTAPMAAPDGSANHATGVAKTSVPLEPPDLGPEPDLLPPPPPDLAPADLTGLTSCYGHAYCDSATMFCLRFFDGSPGKPGAEKLAPSCYAPANPCPNGTLDCNCIQQDANLGPSCAQCFDNKDGTFTCWAQASQ